MVPSLDHAASESYVWAYPGCPVRILLTLNVVEQLQVEVSQAAPWRGEIGGLLIRSKKSKPGTVQIVDFIPLPGESPAADRRFTLPSDSLAEAIARCPSDSKIAGYYRTDINHQVHLRPEDLATVQQWFKDPASVFLVIAGASEGKSTAGFFFWENGSVAVNPSLTFPFDASKLLTEGWPTEAETAEQSRLGAWTAIFTKFATTLRQMSIPLKIGLLSALFALIVGIRIFTWNRSTSFRKPSETPSYGLQVKREGTKFFVTWNPAVTAIITAKDANLVIWDDSRREWDGSSDPIFMPLTSAQLRLGSVTYTSFSLAEKVKFRLDTVGPEGEAGSESMVSIAPLTIANPTSPEPPGHAAAPQIEARKAAPPAPIPAAEKALPHEPPPHEPPPTRDTNRIARLERPAIPTVRQPATQRARTKIFVPPRSAHRAALQHENVMPEPPSYAADNLGAGQSSINTGFNPNAVTAPQPPRTTADTAGTGAASAGIAAPAIGQSNAGVVTITSEPSGARVEINAVPAGVTPLTLQITPVGLGFTVTVSKSGFMKWTVQTFSTAQPYSLHAQLRQLPK